MHGSTSTFMDLVLKINLLSNSNLEQRPVISLSWKQLNRWFITKKGKHVTPLEKPLDIEKHCKERREWVVKNYEALPCPFLLVVFFYEKWFYRVNHWRKVKFLPQSDKQSTSNEAPAISKMLSRRFLVKTSFMRIVARPQKHHDFNGKIFMKRVSKQRYLGTTTRLMTLL